MLATHSKRLISQDAAAVNAVFTLVVTAAAAATAVVAALSHVARAFVVTALFAALNHFAQAGGVTGLSGSSGAVQMEQLFLHVGQMTDAVSCTVVFDWRLTSGVPYRQNMTDRLLLRGTRTPDSSSSVALSSCGAESDMQNLRHGVRSCGKWPQRRAETLGVRGVSFHGDV